MADPNACDPCCDPVQTAYDVLTTRVAVLQLLCSINTAVSGGGGVASNVNVADIAGTATAVNNGTSSAGTIRVTVASDSTGQIKLAAGSALIGTVAIDQTTDGTTNAVHLKAGTAIAGKFGIDQTTDGTTNAVHLVAGTAIAGKVGIDQTTPGTTNAVSIAQLGSTTVATSNGGVSAGTLRVTLANDSTGIVSLTTSTASIGKLAANAGVNIGDVAPIATTTGGFTGSRVSGGLSTSVTAIKSSAQSKLGGYILFNPNSTNAFCQIFNIATAGAVTLGTTAPTISVGLPPFGGANLEMDVGVDYSAGIQVAATTTEAGLTALTTNITANFLFK